MLERKITMSKVNEYFNSEEYENKNADELSKKMECIALQIGKFAKEIYDILCKDEYFRKKL